METRGKVLICSMAKLFPNCLKHFRPSHNRKSSFPLIIRFIDSSLAQVSLIVMSHYVSACKWKWALLKKVTQGFSHTWRNFISIPGKEDFLWLKKQHFTLSLLSKSIELSTQWVWSCVSHTAMKKFRVFLEILFLWIY